jgi:asparagine synthetase B (glutamine-hydrolysing)
MYTKIPIQGFPTTKGTELDRRAIAFWASAGFFFENDSYWGDVKWLELDFDKPIWKYEPRDISLAQAVDEFKNLFEAIVKEHVGSKMPILALSGGLDSRTLAVALKNLDIIPHSYSYRFAGSFEETKYGKAIAKACDWDFDDLTIPEGYLWNQLEEAGRINGCYAEFTHARQVAVVKELASKGEIWLLGHWGDVLFDDMGISSALTDEEQVNVLYRKVLKKGGAELAADLWKAWDLEGDFPEVLRNRLHKMHQRIGIQDANANVRAFKSLYWATRWTTTNLAYFSNERPISLPYYDDRMCEFIMTVPEKWLAGRQIQIEYIKKYAPKLAAIPWQSKAPYNLFDHHKHLTTAHLLYRIANKVKHVAKAKLTGKPLVQRNWEIQFLGKENDQQLRMWLFENPAFEKLVPRKIVQKYYDLFQRGDKVYWSHPLSILLTLSVFSKNEL